jgi:hypothetical protein
VYIQYSGSTATRPPGPIARIFAAIVAAAVLVVAFFLGVVFLISAVIALAIIGAVIAWRTRHLRREIRREVRREAAGGRVLEGEWHEVRSGEGWEEDGRRPGGGSRP